MREVTEPVTSIRLNISHMLTCQRSLFQIPDDEHYLNCAYMSPISLAVEAAGVAGVGPQAVPVDDHRRTTSSPRRHGRARSSRGW